MSSVYQSAHILIREDTHKLTTHTYDIHNHITKHNQPDATVINVNLIIVTVNLNPKSPYNSACLNRI